MLDETFDPTLIMSGIHPGLPGRDYADPAVFAVERDTIFHRSWFCVGRGEEVPEPGNFLTCDVAGESILVTRTKGGDVRAHFNVCRHRGSVLLEQERGHAKAAIVCPYHNWAYGLDGKLVGTPNVHDHDGLDRDAYGLRPVRVEVWEGFLFVNLSEDPVPLLEQLAIEPDGPLDYARYDVGALRIGARVEYDVAADWKIIHDNFNECLHCPSVHPELVQLVPMYRRGMVVDLERPDLGATLADGLTTFTMSGTSPLPFLPGLTDLDMRTYWGYSIFPNLMVNLVSTGVMYFLLVQKSVDRTVIRSVYLFRPETIAQDGFDPSDMVDFGDLVSRQDWAVCERAQRGVGSKGFVQGVYPPQDGLLHLFAERYLAERGPLPGDPA